MNNVRQLADNVGLEGGPDSFKHNIDYTVQPTDDGKKIYAETEAGAP